MCHDYILWQCLLDEIFNEQLTIFKMKTLLQKNSRVLSHVEQNTIRFTASAVIRKLLEREKYDDKKISILHQLMKSKSERRIEDYENTNEKWLITTD